MKNFIISYPKRNFFQKNNLVKQFNYNGFLFIELLLAILLVGSVIAGVIRFLGTGALIRTRTYQRLHALTLASSFMEEMKAGIRPQLGTFSDQEIYAAWQPLAHASYGDKEHLVWIKVDVRWQGSDQKSHICSLITCMERT